VQLAEHWCDVVTSSRASDQPGGGILYRLQASHQLVGDAVVKRITWVQATGDKRLDLRLGGIHRRATDGLTQLTQYGIILQSYCTSKKGAIFYASQCTPWFIKSGPLCIFAITFSNVDRIWMKIISLYSLGNLLSGDVVCNCIFHKYSLYGVI